MKLTTNSKRSSPPGAAHLGMMFRGMSRVLLAPEPSGNAGGAGGSANPAPPPPAPPPEQQGAPSGGNGGTGSGERMYSGAEVERVVQERLARDRRERPSNGQQQAPARQTQQQQSEQGAPAADDGSWMFEVSDALETVVAETSIRPTPAAKKGLREAYRAQRPTDSVGFVRGWFTDMGLIPASSSSSGTAAGTGTSNGTTPQNINSNAGAGTKPDAGKPANVGNTPPLSNLGPPSGGPREFDAITDPNDLTMDDLARLKVQHGEEKANAMIARKVEAWAKGKKLRLRPEKR